MLPGHRQIQGKTAQHVNRKCGSGGLGQPGTADPGTWRVDRYAGQETQEHPAPTYSLSEWTIAPVGGVRRSMAMPRALVTSAAVGVASIDQPTTRREKLSSTTAQ